MNYKTMSKFCLILNRIMFKAGLVLKIPNKTTGKCIDCLGAYVNMHVPDFNMWEIKATVHLAVIFLKTPLPA